MVDEQGLEVAVAAVVDMNGVVEVVVEEEVEVVVAIMPMWHHQRM